MDSYTELSNVVKSDFVFGRRNENFGLSAVILHAVLKNSGKEILKEQNG